MATCGGEHCPGECIPKCSLPKCDSEDVSYIIKDFFMGYASGNIQYSCKKHLKKVAKTPYKWINRSITIDGVKHKLECGDTNLERKIINADTNKEVIIKPVSYETEVEIYFLRYPVLHSRQHTWKIANYKMPRKAKI